MKKSLFVKLRAYLLAFLLVFSCLAFTSCEVGLNDIPTNLVFPDMEEGEDLLGYLARKVINENSDAIRDFVLDFAKTEAENGGLDELVDVFFGSEHYDTILDSFIEEKKDDLIDEVRDILIESGQNDIFTDQQILDAIRTNIEKDDTLRQTIQDSIMTDLLDTDGKFQEDFIAALLDNPDFKQQLFASDEFKNSITDAISGDPILKAAIVDALIADPDFQQLINDAVKNALNP